MKHYFLILLMVFPLFVSACTMVSGNDGKSLAQMTFDHVKPFPVYVASYEPVNMNAKVGYNLPEGFVTNPSDLIFDYLTNRYEASGHQGKLRIEIQDVLIKHALVSSDNAVGSLIGLKKDHYHVKADIDVIALGIGNSEIKKRNLIVSRNIYISDHVSLVEREKLEMQALDSMIDDLDITLRKILKEQFNILR